jgi:hypothetical protein
MWLTRVTHILNNRKDMEAVIKEFCTSEMIKHVAHGLSAARNQTLHNTQSSAISALSECKDSLRSDERPRAIGKTNVSGQRGHYASALQIGVCAEEKPPAVYPKNPKPYKTYKPRTLKSLKKPSP